mgnify:FL=1
MPKDILYLLFPFLFKVIVCTLKEIVIANDLDFLYRDYFYCAQSPNKSLHIFYRASSEYHHEIFDGEEKPIGSYDNNAKKIEFFEFQNAQYLILGEYLYYIDGLNKNEISFGTANNFYILENKDIIIIKSIVSIKLKYYLKIDYYSYPISSESKFSVTLKDIYIKHYEIIETPEAVLFFFLIDEGVLEYPLDLYVLNKNTFTLKKHSTINSAITGFTILDFKENKNSFIYCMSFYFDDSKCIKAQYKNANLKTITSINLFSWKCVLSKEFNGFMKTYENLNYNERIMILCPSKNTIDMAILEDNNITLNVIEEKEIISYSTYFAIERPFLMYNAQKGIIIYYIKQDIMANKYSLIKSYFEESCSSFEMKDLQPYSRNEINFYKYISGGENNNKISFMITDFNTSMITLTRNGESVKPGNTIYNNNISFFFTSEDTLHPLIIKFKNVDNDYTCNVIITYFHNFIKVKDKSYVCMISPNRTEINDISYTDLDKRVNIHGFYGESFYINFDNPAEYNDLQYRFLNTYFSCEHISKKEKEKIRCIFPVFWFDLEDDLIKADYDIYSTLSCTNDIYIGRMTIEDPYLIEVINASNLTEISKKIDKTYDPSEKIEKFSIDMINYYYWFSSFAYCDDEYIVSGDCCKDEILSDWEYINNYEYSYSVQDFIDLFFEINGERQKSLEDIIEEYIREQFILIDLIEEEREKIIKYIISEILKAYITNFAILKSDKYKKYVFTFSGVSTLLQVFTVLFGCNLIPFENYQGIKVDNWNKIILSLIKNDLYSETILSEIKKHKDYQIIFTGHSFGGATATLASYYFAKKKLAENELVLITFGQTRVGNEEFARDYMKLIKNVYRIAREDDIVSMWPPVKRFDESKIYIPIKLYYIIKKFYTYRNEIFKDSKIINNILRLVKDSPKENKEKISELSEELGFNIIKFYINYLDSYVRTLSKFTNVPGQLSLISDQLPHDYCHIGGFYVLNQESNKFYHCVDFYNEETTNYYCKNWEISISKIQTLWIPNSVKSQHYLTTEQIPRERCQPNKKFRFMNKYF